MKAPSDPELFLLLKIGRTMVWPSNVCVWWRSHAVGYTAVIAEAGPYTAAEVARIGLREGGRGGMGPESNLAVPMETLTAWLERWPDKIQPAHGCYDAGSIFTDDLPAWRDYILRLEKADE